VADADPVDEGTPFEGFEIETESMPDGRSIHYYRWPETDGDRAEARDDQPTRDV
jgi:hypothetical protein